MEDADVLLGVAALKEHLDVVGNICRRVEEPQLAASGVLFFREQNDKLSRHSTRFLQVKGPDIPFPKLTDAARRSTVTRIGLRMVQA